MTIKKELIKNEAIEDGAISTDKIQDGAIMSSKIHPTAISGVMDNSIDTQHLINYCITNLKIEPLAVDNSKIATDLNVDKVDGFHSTEITPIATIVARLPGYFLDGSNAGYTPISIDLPDNWKICDGSECYDEDSPIFNQAGRFLPNLTDSRFIIGSTTPGQVGGNSGNEVTLAVGNLPSHTHSIAHGHTDTIAISGTGSHTHYGFYNMGPNYAATGLLNNTSNPYAQTYGGYGHADNQYCINGHTSAPNCAISSATGHSHSISGGVNSIDATSYSGSTGSGTAFSILPKYLSAQYIIRIK